MGTFFIQRPVFAAVISIIITLIGLLAYRFTPVTQYPDIAPPTVSVSAFYPGATAEVVANTVAAPLEEVINGVDGMMYMNSSSTSAGAMTLTVTFDPTVDPNTAQVNVQNRVNQKLQSLPEEVRTSVTVQKRSGSYLMAISISAQDGRYDPMYIGNYANLYVLDAIKRIPGANNAALFPTPDLAMRIWLKPEQLARLAITTQDIMTAIQQQNKAYGVGVIGQTPTPAGTEQSFAVSAKGMLSDPAEFEAIIVRAAREGSAIVRLKDVARVELALKDYGVVSRLNGQDASIIIVNQQAGSNAIEVSRQVRELLETLKPQFPSGIDYKIVQDSSVFTQASIDKVLETFRDAVILVVLVVFLFLQSLRATIIPILAVPIAIIGTFIGIKLLGFSANMLTLFGLILSIGLVVDDAIIVVEAVEKNIAELGLSPIDATVKAMRELTGALITIVLVLGSVFLPVAFISGMTGTLYKQFAVTIAISMVLSGVVALTLSPALAARILKPGHAAKSRFFSAFESGFVRLTERYVRGVRWLISHRLAAGGLFAGMLLALTLLFKLVPSGFVPDEDQGFLYGFSILPDAASLERTTQLSHKVLPLLRSNPAVEDVFQVDGLSPADGNKSSASLMFIPLKPYDKRTQAGSDAFSVIGDLGAKLSAVVEGVVFAINPPAIDGLGGLNGFEFYIQNKGSGSAQALAQVTQAVELEAAKRKELLGVRSSFSASQQQIYIDVDRERAELLGVKMGDLHGTLQAYFGSVVVSNFMKNGRISQVIVQADGQYRDKPDDLTQVQVRSASTQAMVPLASLATLRYTTGPGNLPHFNGFPAAVVNGSKAPGYSSGQAIAAMEQVAQKVLPAGYAFAWSGQELEEKKSGNTSTWAFATGLILVFLILAAQYEKWSLPIGVMLSVPFAICGALLIVWLLGLENNVYFQVGLLTLVGLSAKNAILIIEYAADNRRRGMTAVEAALQASRHRFRPIVMTSLAFVLGCIPMALAQGAGAHSQRAIGTGVIGGMLASTLVASLFVPFFFVMLDDASQWVKRFTRTRAPDQEADHA